MKRLSLILISALCTASIQAQHVDFRGANHCGIYTNEKNLLKQWPEGGPQKLWVVNDRLYMVSNMGELVCLSRADGKILWKVDY